LLPTQLARSPDGSIIASISSKQKSSELIFFNSSSATILGSSYIPNPSVTLWGIALFSKEVAFISEANTLHSYMITALNISNLSNVSIVSSIGTFLLISI
jgi:hypothetical protein